MSQEKRKLPQWMWLLVVLGIPFVAGVTGFGWGLNMASDATAETEPLALSGNVYVNENPTAFGVPYGGVAVVYAEDGWPETSAGVPTCWSNDTDRATYLLAWYVLKGIDKSDGHGEYCDRRNVDPEGYVLVGDDSS